MNFELDFILARVPELRAASSVSMTELGGGITNRNFRIDADGQAYVLRVGGKDTHLLGIDRRVEYGCTRAAAQAGVGPEPVAFLEPEGWLITRFIPGAAIPAEAIGAEANVRRVVSSLKRVHAIESFPGSFSPFRVAEAYERVARDHGVPLPERMGRFLEASAEIERAMRRAPERLVACHNDLLNGNFIDDGERIRILDWEYAGMGDLFFDLGNFAVQHAFTGEQDEILLRAYFGDPTSAHYACLKLMKIMSDLREAMWGLVQIGISTLDFDYAGYARKYFDRFEAGLGQPEFSRWLEDAEISD